MAKTIGAIRKWWFIIQCRRAQRQFDQWRAEQEIRLLQRLRSEA